MKGVLLSFSGPPCTVAAASPVPSVALTRRPPSELHPADARQTPNGLVLLP